MLTGHDCGNAITEINSMLKDFYVLFIIGGVNFQQLFPLFVRGKLYSSVRYNSGHGCAVSAPQIEKSFIFVSVDQEAQSFPGRVLGGRNLRCEKNTHLEEIPASRVSRKLVRNSDLRELT